MCKNAYEKVNSKTKHNMYYCHCFDNEDNEIKRLCLYQRYCSEKCTYIFNNFNNEKRCKKYNC